MIIAFGKLSVQKIMDGAISLSNGINACHEYSKSCPTDKLNGIRHHDGWGAYMLGDNSFALIKRAGKLDSSAVRMLTELDSTILIVHTRNATVENKVGIQYVHPVQKYLNGSPTYFFHNGYAPDVFHLLGRRCSLWDSEELYEWLAPAFASGSKIMLEQRLRQLPPTTTSANFIFVERKRLIVCNWFRLPNDAPLYYTMQLFSSKEQLVIASDWVSEIAPREKWSSIPNKTIFYFDPSNATSALKQKKWK